MKKFRFILSFLIITVISVAMCICVFGYSKNAYFFCDKYLLDGVKNYTSEQIAPKETDYSSFTLHYDYITGNGSFTTGVYQKDKYGKYVSCKTRKKSVLHTYDSGFTTARIYLTKNQQYFVAIQCDDTHIMCDKLSVLYD